MASADRLLGLAALLAGSLAGAGTAQAQAWLPPKGEGAVSVTLGHYSFDGHFASDGRRDPFGGTRAWSVWTEVSYALTDRLSVSASLPFVSTKLTGEFPDGVPLGPLDDGRYHGDFQDFRFEAAFMARGGDLAVTPFVGLAIPSHSYEIVGEAVPGKGLRELLLGLGVGRTLGPRAYAHARYAYAFLEKALPGVDRLDRSNLDAEVGYAVHPRFSLRLSAGVQVTHGGLDLEDMRSHPSFFRTHDRAARTNYVNLGGGASYALADAWNLHAIVYETVSGENAHQARSLSAGASWRFGGGFGRRAAGLTGSPRNPPAARGRRAAGRSS